MTLIDISEGRTINPDKIILIYAKEGFRHYDSEKPEQYYAVHLEGQFKELISEADYRKLKEGS